MELPQMAETVQERDMILNFGGYNHNTMIGDNEFYDMKNMTSDFYPVLSPRVKRGVVKNIANPNGLYAKNGLIYVDGKELYYKNTLIGEVTDTEKKFVGMGAYVAVFPDKKYFNTNDSTITLKDMGHKDVFSVTETNNITYTPCKLDGTNISVATQATAPTSPTNGTYWNDTSTNSSVLKQWQESTSQWIAVATSYIKVASTVHQIGKNFNQYDVVNISGSNVNELNMDMCIWAKGDNYIVVIAMPSATTSMTNGTLTIERKVPDLDYVTECNNRIWGCNSEKHEVYCCKQGDLTNWYSYLGNANDSYAATVGTDGDFTGAATCLGYVLFFKENLLHKVQGTMPSNYQIATTDCRGVQKGSAASIQIVNETLYYKSRDSVCAYEGGLPDGISESFGTAKYKEAVAGEINSKYYISMTDAENNGTLFVYDTEKGLWHKEDDTKIKYFAFCNNELYGIDAENRLISMTGADGEKENSIEWMIESGVIGMNMPDNKYISKLTLRLAIVYGGKMDIYIQYDSSGMWRKETTLESKIMKSNRTIPSFTKMRSFTVPILPRRCDHMKIRFKGIGDCKIYSISKTIEQGSEL